MRTNVIIVIILVVLSTACKKNWMTRDSNLTLTSISTDSLNLNNNLTFNFEFSHPYSEDINDTLFVRVNYKTCSLKTFDTTRFLVPSFTNVANQVCKLQYIFTYGGGGPYLAGCQNGNGSATRDSAYFQFCLVDAKNNHSDTIKTKMILLNKY